MSARDARRIWAREFDSSHMNDGLGRMGLVIRVDDAWPYRGRGRGRKSDMLSPARGWSVYDSDDCSICCVRSGVEWGRGLQIRGNISICSTTWCAHTTVPVYISIARFHVLHYVRNNKNTVRHLWDLWQCSDSLPLRQREDLIQSLPRCLKAKWKLLWDYLPSRKNWMNNRLDHNVKEKRTYNR